MEVLAEIKQKYEKGVAEASTMMAMLNTEGYKWSATDPVAKVGAGTLKRKLQGPHFRSGSKCNSFHTCLQDIDSLEPFGLWMSQKLIHESLSSPYIRNKITYPSQPPRLQSNLFNVRYRFF
eukprot:6472500-Amphidinium_carterae.2